MENKINVAELLKDCPKGMELDCTMYDNCILEMVFEDCLYPIQIKTPEGLVHLTKYGCFSQSKHSKCVIFPKGKTSWKGFVPPCKFKDGDILYIDCTDECDDKQYDYIFILNRIYNGEFHSYCHYYIPDDEFQIRDLLAVCLTNDKYPIRFATEEEKQKLFKAIKDNGYKWNAETKTLQPYKEETMEEKFEQITFDIPKGYEFFGINDDNQVVLAKKQPIYPKTYDECCDVLKIPNDERYIEIDVPLDYNEILLPFTELLICRDAYWKIAGEEMGLGKPWEPYWDDDEWPDMDYISFDGKHIDKEEGYPCCNMILIFPTEEMRDAFYENFKDLIETCKELLKLWNG